MINLILRAIIIYIIVLFAVRLMGKRQIGDMQPFELVVTLIIADLACIPMSDVAIPMVFGVVPLLTLVVLHHVLTIIIRKSVFFRTFLNGKPVVIINKNGIDYEAMKKLNITLNDLTEGLRANNCFDIADVAFAIVETNGNFSVLLKADASPTTNKNMNIKADPSALNIILVNDGKVLENNLAHFNLDCDFVNKVMKQQKTKKISDILILTLSQNGNVFYQEKTKSSVCFERGDVK